MDDVVEDSDADIVEDAWEFYNAAKDAESENRERYVDSCKFALLGEQWPENIIRDRERDMRPCLTFNKLAAMIKQCVNDARMNRPKIEVLPVGADSDKDTAGVLEGLIRNIECISNASIAYDICVENQTAGGFGYLMADIDYAYDDSFDLDIKIKAVPNPLQIFGDYRSVEPDGCDWNECIIPEWITCDEFEKRYPDAEKANWDEDFMDRPDTISEDSVLIAAYWKRVEVDALIHKLSNGIVIADEVMKEQSADMENFGITVVETRSTKCWKVTQYILSGSEVLKKVDWPGKYIPVVLVPGNEVNIEGKRTFHSLHHHARGAQQSYNYWRTSAVEKVALDVKPTWLGPRGAFNSDAAKWQTSNMRNWATLQYDGDIPPQRIIGGGVPAGDIQMALAAADDIQSIIGMHDASMGAQSNEISGVAIRQRRIEGDTSTFHIVDNLSRGIAQIGKIIVDLIPHVYTSERILRVLGEDGSPEEVAVNQQFLQDGIPRIYDLTVGKYDVIVKTGPGFTSKREESAAQMMSLVQSFPDLAPMIGDLIAKNLDWPGSDEIANRIKAMQPQPPDPNAPPPPNPEMDQAKLLIQQGYQQLQAMQVEIDKLKLQLADKSAENEIAAGELRIKQEEFELKRATTVMRQIV